VLNGSGVRGAAGAAQTALLARGFTSGGAVGDADHSDYSATEVRYGPGAKDKARLVAAYLGGVGTLVPSRPRRRAPTWSSCSAATSSASRLRRAAAEHHDHRVDGRAESRHDSWRHRAGARGRRPAVGCA